MPTWLVHRCPLEWVETYGEVLTCPHGHHDLWEEWRVGGSPAGAEAAPDLPPGVLRTVRSSEYDDWPRGRIVREPTRWVVYADAQLLRPERRAALLDVFELDPDATVFRRDAHYARARSV